jgi:hypothetical protein
MAVYNKICALAVPSFRYVGSESAEGEKVIIVK